MAAEEQRNRVAVRLVRLIRLLDQESHLPTFADLACVLRVCERTVRRDLAALDEAGWPLPPKRQQEAAA